MELNEYQELANKLAVECAPADDLVHCAMGVCTESGELMDIIKRNIFYGKDVDKTHVIEELGDILWYVAVGCRAMGISMRDVAVRNINKLQARYPEGFTADAALNRDLEKEREILEDN